MNETTINQNIIKKYYSYIESFSSKKKSIKERKKAVHYFMLFLKCEKLSIPSVETKDMDSFLIFLKNGKYKTDNKSKIVGPSSIAQIIALLKSFFQWCFETHHIQLHPDLIITKIFKSRLPKQDRRPKTYMSVEDLLKFIDDSSNKWKALLFVMYDTMARINTVLNIKIGDFDCELKTIRLYESKNNVYLEHDISELTAFHLSKYIEKYRPALRNQDSEPGYIFISKNRTRLTARAVQGYIRDRSKKELGKKLTPHNFRGLGITHMLESGAQLATVQDIVGHATPATTARYNIGNPVQRKKVKTENHPLLAKTVNQTKKQIGNSENSLMEILKTAEDELDSILNN